MAFFAILGVCASLFHGGSSLAADPAQIVPPALHDTMVAPREEGRQTNPASVLLPLPDEGPRYVLPASGPGIVLFQQGVAAYRNGQRSAADMFFRDFITKFHQSPLIDAASAFLAELARIDSTPAPSQTAIEAYRTLLRKFPGSPNASRARWRIGDLYAEQGWWYEAQVAYKRAIGDASVIEDAVRARLGLGVALLAEKKWNEAATLFEDIGGHGPDERLAPTAAAGRAEAWYGAKRIGDAKRLYESSFRRWPDFFKQHAELLRHYGEAAAASGQDADARRAFLLLYNLYPRHHAAPSWLIAIGDTFRRADRPAHAHLFYAAAATHYPNAMAATVARMRLTELGQDLQSGARIDPMIRQSLRHTPPLIIDPTEQRESLSAIADTQTETTVGSEARFHLGEHFERAGRCAEAVQVYRGLSDRDGCIAGDPWPGAAWRRLSGILEPWLAAALKAGDDGASLTLFHRHGAFADRVYGGKEILVQVAGVHLKDHSAAPLREEALIGLGACYLDQRDFTAARKVFERYRIQYPLGRFKLDALASLAAVFQSQGMLPEAIRLSKQWLDTARRHADRPRMWQRLAPP